MEKVKISDICDISNGFAFKSDNYIEDNTTGARIIRITNVQKGKIVDNDPKYYPFNLLDKLDNYKIYEGDIMMSLTGNVGRVGRFPKEMLPAYINQRICKIMPKDNRLDVNYLFHFLNSDSFENEAMRNSSGAAQLNLSSKWLNSFQILLPSLAEQKAIAEKLDKAQVIIRYNEEIIAKYDVLTQSLFLEMFGDPVKNEKGWEKVKLGDLGDFKNGLNYTKSENGITLKVLGVGDFKNYWKIDNLENLSFVEMNIMPNKDFALQNEDLIFVRSNGNKDLVGRCLVIYPKEETISYSGFCIRFRKNTYRLNVIYLVQLLQRIEFKKHIFKNGRGANIQNINQELLNNVEIQLPTIQLQNQFAERVAAIEAQKQLAQESLAKSQELFQSLLKGSFKN